MKKPSVFEVAKDLEKIKSGYKKGDTEWLVKAIGDYYDRYKSIPSIGNTLHLLGAAYIQEGDRSAGITIFNFLTEQNDYACNSMYLLMHMADYYFENGDTDKGIECLTRVCTSVADYEVSFALYGLTDIWKKYKHFVKGKVPASIPGSSSGKQPLLPSECSMKIAEIFTCSDNGIMLTDLSTHLHEMSANGEAMNYLNKWERTAYYTFELCNEVGSGGFDCYFNVCFQHFEKAYQAFSDISAESMIALMDRVREKFPRNKIPKTFDALVNALDKIEEKGMDFEDEDDAFYDREEKLLIDALLKYVVENKKHFR